MKINHIIDDLVKETILNIVTTSDNTKDYNYIKNIVDSSTSHLIGRDLDLEKEVKVSDKDIIYIETYGRDVCFTTIDNKFLVIKISMKKLEDIISNRNYFLKISKGTIINVKHIEEISYQSNMRFQILLTNGYKQLVNRSYFKDFKSCIEEVYN
ncbi:MAG: LytTR family DNA-binding domain-containing protein [Peptostreptococcaceae bacterium]